MEKQKGKVELIGPEKMHSKIERLAEIRKQISKGGKGREKEGEEVKNRPQGRKNLSYKIRN